MKTENCSVVWKCHECGKEFKYESEKRRHEHSHAPQFQCRVCLKKFSFLSALRRHEKQHERKGSICCDECGGKFRDEILLKRHMQYAHKGSFACSKCKATFSSELALRTHSKTHKTESERDYRCSYEGCGRTFNFSHHLKHHELTHTDAKQHFCKHCGKGFIQSYHLKIHQKVHEPESWLSCTIINCKKWFTNEYALKRHLSTHKNKTELAISTKNIKHNGKTISIKDMSLCKTCNQFISSCLFKKHTETCMPYESQEFNTALLNLQISDIKQDEIKDDDQKNEVYDNIGELDLDIEENAVGPISDCKPVLVDSIVTKIEDTDQKNEVFDNIGQMDIEENAVGPISDCKSALGGCIVTGRSERSENCLCAQITGQFNTEDIFTDSITQNSVQLPKDDLGCIDKRRRYENACEGCECVSTCGIKNNLKEGIQEIPELESRNDGIIKIKQIFDLDIEEFNANEIIQSTEIKIEFEDFGSSINTCKEVLGKCIVSGNGTIGEGCLCAKMSANNQELITQEIEEITPCPKNTWLSQRL